MSLYHMESDEISCSCGFVADAEEYVLARLQLEHHLLEALEPPASDPRPDPRTHPEHWTE